MADEKKMLTTGELAKRWRMSAITLGNWRVAGKGPHYSKIGRQIFYLIEDVEEYERSQRVSK